MIDSFFLVEDRRSIGTARLYAQQINLNRGKDDKRIYDVPDVFPSLAYLFEADEDQAEPDPQEDAMRWIAIARASGATIDPAVYEVIKNSNGQ